MRVNVSFIHSVIHSHAGFWNRKSCWSLLYMKEKKPYLNQDKSLIFVGKKFVPSIYDKFIMRTFFQSLPFLSPSYINTIWSLNCFEWLFLSLLPLSPSVRGLSTKPRPPDNGWNRPSNFKIQFWSFWGKTTVLYMWPASLSPKDTAFVYMSVCPLRS